MDKEFISKFWEKVHSCKHEHLDTNYHRYIPCGTPYCGGSESHCLDCGVYITECYCGFNNGMSGWPLSRWTKKYEETGKLW